MTTEELKTAIKARLEVTLALGEAIRELGQVPAGHLYANVMHVLDLDQFEACIATLVRSGLVKRHASHLLEWVGPRSAKQNVASN